MDDLISRSALLEAYDKAHQGPPSGARKLIEDAPEAIVRCKDCRWWDKKEREARYGYCGACKHGYLSPNWEIGIYRVYREDWFCADGERKD